MAQYTIPSQLLYLSMTPIQSFAILYEWKKVNSEYFVWNAIWLVLFCLIVLGNIHNASIDHCCSFQHNNSGWMFECLVLGWWVKRGAAGCGFWGVQRVKRGWLLRGKPAFHPSIVVVKIGQPQRTVGILYKILNLLMLVHPLMLVPLMLVHLQSSKEILVKLTNPCPPNKQYGQPRMRSK